MERAKKQATVEQLHEVFGQASLIVVAQQKGLTVLETTALRRQMRLAGANYKVAKNRLAKRAAAGTQFEGVVSLFKGPTAIAWSRDPVAAARVVADFAKKNDRLTIVGGALARQALDAAGVKALASLPSLDELRARLIGALTAPAARLIAVLQAPGGQLARVAKARGESEGKA